MNVILLEDLKGVGAKGALVHVKPGYARNYLLPQRLAIPAGNRAANLFQELQRQRQVQDDKRIATARAEAARLEGVEINIPAQANDEDTLFGSITSADVAKHALLLCAACAFVFVLSRSHGLDLSAGFF